MADHSDPAGLLIRPVHPGDDMEAQLELAERSFGPMSPSARDRWRQSVASLANSQAHARYSVLNYAYRHAARGARPGRQGPVGS